MLDITSVLARLKGVKKAGNGYLAFCPAHNDVSNRSLSIGENERGEALLHCFCGCTYKEILDALNIHLEPAIFQEEQTYDYVDEQGNLLYQVVRYYPKNFKHRHKENGKWIWNLNGVRRVLFQFPQIIQAISEDKPIYFVEGEKDCLNLSYYGLTATSCSGGANAKWELSYTETLKGAKVIIIPDDDKPGWEHAHKVANYLYGWAKSLKILTIGAKDVTEWLKTHNIDELKILQNNTPEYIPQGAVTRDEFNELRGHTIYLHTLLREHLKFHLSRRKPKLEEKTYEQLYI